MVDMTTICAVIKSVTARAHLCVQAERKRTESNHRKKPIDMVSPVLPRECVGNDLHGTG
jgi:hypothetical protein